MLNLGLVLVVLAFILLWRAARLARGAGLPSGRVIYSDTSKWGKVEIPLYDPLLKLTGKPDYLVTQNGTTIPVEVKSGWAPDAPYAGHLYQLAAYCLLVERSSRRPPYGILRYRNRTFAVDYTPQMEAELLNVLAEMRRDETRRSLPRSHEEPGRCARCGYRGACDQRL